MAADDQRNIHNLSDYRQTTGGPSQDRLKSGGGGGTSGGMDGWQTSVEARLNEIKTDVRDLRTGVGALNVTAATLTERVAHLPSKGFIGTALLALLAIMAALITFQGQIQTFLKLHH